MPSVGPQLPPHLMKRKRGEEDDASNGSATPPTKIRAASPPQPRVLGPSMPPQPTKNEDEIALDDSDDSDDDDMGPALLAGPRKPAAAPARVVGPSMPSPQNDDEIALDDSDNDVGPAPPQAQPTAAPRRVLGPAPPPAPLDQMPPQPANDSDSDSDDDYGPSLPPPPGSAAAYAAEAELAQEVETARQAARSEPAKPQRAEWMLAPPSGADWGSRVDPTKLKNRKFASGKGAKGPAEKSVISAIWTETPVQKRQRLEDEVLGRKDAANSSNPNAGREEGGRDREAEETARRIREYTEKQRGKSLVEQHMGKKEGEGRKEEDDPSKRAFDREKDMALGGLGLGQKRDMIKKAGEFGSRFEKGKFL